MTERYLVIDCATPALSIALFDDDALIASSHAELGRGHAEALLPAIAALPEGGRCDRILVDVGPGSFTGVRVGVAAAVSLGFGWDVPVEGYGCLDLVAAMARKRLAPQSDFAVVMVGGHGELFWAIAPAGDDSLLQAAPLAIHSTAIDALARMIGVQLFVGSGAQILIDAGASGHAVQLLPDAREALRLPLAQRQRKPVPDYGRSADAKPMASPRIRTPVEVR